MNKYTSEKRTGRKCAELLETGEISACSTNNYCQRDSDEPALLYVVILS